MVSQQPILETSASLSDTNLGCLGRVARCSKEGTENGVKSRLVTLVYYVTGFVEEQNENACIKI